MNKFSRIAEDLVDDLKARAGRNVELQDTIAGIDTDLDSMGTLISVLERRQVQREDVQDIFAHLLAHVTEEMDVLIEELDLDEGIPAMDKLVAGLFEWFDGIGIKSAWLGDVLNSAMAVAGDEDGEPDENPDDDEGEPEDDEGEPEEEPDPPADEPKAE